MTERHPIGCICIHIGMGRHRSQPRRQHQGSGHGNLCKTFHGRFMAVQVSRSAIAAVDFAVW